MAGNDVIITTDNVQILHIDFTASSTKPIYWRSKSILVLLLYHLLTYDEL